MLASYASRTTLTTAQRDAFLNALLRSPAMQALWGAHDRGTPVFVHSLDVALLCLEQGDERHDFDASLIGALVHDYSKLASRDGGPSHSLVMRTRPELAAELSMGLVSEAEELSGVDLDDALWRHLQHIVMSHHGRHGKVQPTTRESWLVARCDQISGTEHRIVPVDANDILPLLSEGYKWNEAAALLGVGRELVKTRLREACDAAGVREWVELLPAWRAHGCVAAGTTRRQAQIERARLVTRLAHQGPETLVERLRPGVAGLPMPA